MLANETISKKLPIPYVYCILICIGLGILTGVRQYYVYQFYLPDAESGRWTVQFWTSMLNKALWGFLVPVVYYVYRKFRKKGNRLGIGRRVFLSSIAVAAFHELISYVIYFGITNRLGAAALRENIIEAVSEGFLAGFISQWIIFWIIYAILAALVNARRFREKQVELAVLQSQLSEAKLSALKYQMQPHFLFNTLNSVSSLIDIDRKTAQDVIARLGQLLRIILEKDARNSIPLSEELSFIQNYLSIEEIRFHDRLKVLYEIDESVKETTVPRLILQPLVENAVKHGLRGKESDAQILIAARRFNEKQVLISVFDNGKGSNQSLDALILNGLGLKNVHERLQLRYGDDSRLELKSVPEKGFEIRMILPEY